MKQTEQPRKIRQDLTKEELERLERHGSISFQSAGANSWAALTIESRRAVQ